MPRFRYRPRPPSRHDHSNQHRLSSTFFISVLPYRSVSTATFEYLISFHARVLRYAHGRGSPVVTTVCMFCGSNIESSDDTHAVERRRERAAGMTRREREREGRRRLARATRGKCTPDKSSFARRIINSPSLLSLPSRVLFQFRTFPSFFFFPSRAFSRFAPRSKRTPRNAVRKRWKASSRRRKKLITEFFAGRKLNGCTMGLL